MKYKFFQLIIIFFFSLFYSKFVFAEKLFINSQELSHLEKIKNIKNKKKEKPRKDGITYVGQKKLILENGYGIMRFIDGGLFVGYFHNGALRDGAWIIKGDVSYEKYEYIKKNKPKKDSKGIPVVKKTEFRVNTDTLANLVNFFWVHVFTKSADGATMKIYRDGVEVASRTNAGACPTFTLGTRLRPTPWTHKSPGDARPVLAAALLRRLLHLRPCELEKNSSLS